jgi:pilus assembly protein Flp/PilA
VRRGSREINGRSQTQSGRTHRTVKMLLVRLLVDDSGQDLIEYAIIGALIAIVAITGLNGLANKINSEFTKIGSDL